MQLAYRTRNNKDPKGLSRIYFVCHPDDFEMTFDKICDDIFKQRDCVIYYDAEHGMEIDRALLEEMQMVIAPITKRFVNADAFPITKELKASAAIPVLPVIWEEEIQKPELRGLLDRLNEKSGNLQTLNKFFWDPTEDSYEEKLRRFLSLVLPDDKLAERIENVFRARMFLSYRKCDREDARKLMKQIHENPLCQDIAVWYDEFLNPGENFNDGIRQALLDSQLYVLLVTDSLFAPPADYVPDTENPSPPPNYVQKHEYPMAVENGKLVIPIEMRPVDRVQLEKSYAGIPKCVDGDNGDEIADALLKNLKKLGIRESVPSWEARYLLGMAYLNGKNVEVNKDLGVDLIRDAAEHDEPEAMRQLVTMYRLGMAVDHDYEEMIKWQKRLVEYREKRFQQSGLTSEILSEMVEETKKLGALCNEFGRLTEALEAWKNVEAVMEAYLGERPAEDSGMDSDILRKSWSCGFLSGMGWLGALDMDENTLLYMQGIYRELLRLSIDLKDYENQEKYANYILKIHEMRPDPETYDSLRMLGEVFYRLGYAYRDRTNGDLQKAEMYYKKCLEITKQMKKLRDIPEANHSLGVTYNELGEFYYESSDWEKAEQMYTKALEVEAPLYDQYEINVIFDASLSGTYWGLGRVYMQQKSYDRAAEKFDKALHISERVYNYTRNVYSRNLICNIYEDYGRLFLKQDNIKKATSFLLECLKIRIDLYANCENSLYRENFMITCIYIRTLSYVIKDWEEWLVFYQEVVRLLLEAEEEFYLWDMRLLVVNCYRKRGDIYTEKGYFIQARQEYQHAWEECQNIKENYYTDNRYKKFSRSKDFWDILSSLAAVCQKTGDMNAARKYGQHWVDGHYRLYKESGDQSLVRDISNGYFRLAQSYETAGMLEQAEQQYQHLADLCLELYEYSSQNGRREKPEHIRHDFYASTELLSKFYERHGFLDQAVKAWLKCLDHADEYSIRYDSYVSLSDFFLEQKRVDDAIEYRTYAVREAENWYLATSSDVVVKKMSQTYKSLAGCLMSWAGRDQEALPYYEKAARYDWRLLTASKTEENIRALGIICGLLGCLVLELDMDRAISYFSVCLYAFDQMSEGKLQENDRIYISEANQYLSGYCTAANADLKEVIDWGVDYFEQSCDVLEEYEDDKILPF